MFKHPGSIWGQMTAIQARYASHFIPLILKKFYFALVSFPTIMADQNRNLHFSWLEDGKLAALAWPGTKKDIEFLHAEGIRWLVSLTERSPSLHGVSGMKLIHIPVPDLKPPTVEQIQQFIQITDKAHEREGVRAFVNIYRDL